MADPAPPQSDNNIDLTGSKPTHFVRTFATDAAAVQSGLRADFTKSLKPEALKESSEDILARATAKASERGPEPLDINATEMQAEGRPGAFANEPANRPGDRLVAPTLVPEPTPARESAPILPPLPPTPTGPAPLHTYQSDFRTEVRDTGASKVSILAREQDAGPRSTAIPEKRSNTLLYVAGAILVVIGFGGALAAYFYSSGKPTTVPVTPVATARIFVDARAQIAGSGPTLVSAVEKQSQTMLAQGAVRLLYVSTSTANGSDVFSLLRLPAPDILLRNIQSVNSLAGIVNSGGETPFFILGVDSYGDTFAGMLSWEPRMQNDLQAFYPLYAAPAAPVAPVATTTSKSKGKTATTTPAAPIVPVNSPVGFVDQVVDNHDSRVLKDRLGRTLIVYGYFDQHTLVIARDEPAFTEIINRLATSRTQKQ